MNKIISLEKSLNQISELRPNGIEDLKKFCNEMQKPVKFFLKEFFEVYSSLHDKSDELKAFVEETAPSVIKRTFALDLCGTLGIKYYIPTSGGFSLYGLSVENWTDVCLQRSQIEIVNQLYSKYSDHEYIIDPEDIDDEIRRSAELEGHNVTDRKPQILDSSHWWWDVA